MSLSAEQLNMARTDPRRFLEQALILPIYIQARTSLLNDFQELGDDGKATVNELEKKLESMKTLIVDIYTLCRNCVKDDQCRLALELRFFKGLKIKEVAECLDYTYRWTLYIINRALKAFVDGLPPE